MRMAAGFAVLESGLVRAKTPLKFKNIAHNAVYKHLIW
jgi:hypothetical protein